MEYLETTFEHGTDSSLKGSCPTGSVKLPLSSLGGGDGIGQMNHFVKDDGLNMFRLRESGCLSHLHRKATRPLTSDLNTATSWQYLVANKLGSSLDASNLAKYDQLVQACLATGAHCMIELHNFARYHNAIIGQGGPTDEQFAALWGGIAAKYASNERIVFELMNEPHDLDVGLWAKTCGAAIAAIRNAGATKQMILLPGTNFDSAATLISSGSADALLALTNPDGTTDGLLLDVHKYLDVDNSGTHRECTTDNVVAFQSLADYLRGKGRKALVSETGASMDASCMTAFCAQNAAINANSDVYVGLVAWAAGSFDTGYVLTLTPSKSGNTFTDNALMKQCVLGPWNAAVAVPTSSTGPAPAPATSAGSRSSSTSVTSGTSNVNTATRIGDYTVTVKLPKTNQPDSTLYIATGEPTPTGRFPAGYGSINRTNTLTSAASGTGAAASTVPTTIPSGALDVRWSAGLLMGAALLSLLNLA